MFTVTHYNEFSKNSRVVCSYKAEGTYEEVRKEAVYRAGVWNRSETRANMLVNFLLIGDKFFTV